MASPKSHCRKDFTLSRLFACLVVKQQMRRSYRGAEELLRDSGAWLRDVGLSKAPGPQPPRPRREERDAGGNWKRGIWTQ